MTVFVVMFIWAAIWFAAGTCAGYQLAHRKDGENR